MERYRQPYGARNKNTPRTTQNLSGRIVGGLWNVLWAFVVITFIRLLNKDILEPPPPRRFEGQGSLQGWQILVLLLFGMGLMFAAQVHFPALGPPDIVRP